MIKAVAKSLRLLEYVSASGGAVKLSQIARFLGENPSTCAGIVKTLTEAGYLQKDPVRGYRLGIMAVALAHGDLYDPRLLLAGHRLLPPAALEQRMYLSLAVLRDNVRHSILEVSDRGEVLMQARANAVVMNSATGLMLVSHQPRARQDELLEYYGVPRRFGGYEEFIRYLDGVREQGYVEIVHPHPTDMVAIAVPVRDGDAVIAALGGHVRGEQRSQQPLMYFTSLLDTLSAALSAELT